MLPLGLPHGGAEVQPLTYVLEHWENIVTSTSVRDWRWGPAPGADPKMLLRLVLSAPDTNLHFANLRFGNPPIVDFAVIGFLC